MAKEPKPSDWWERKWKMAIFGAALIFLSIAAGMLITVYKGAGIGDAVKPFGWMGVISGLGLVLAFVAPATIENVVQFKQGGILK